MVEKSVLPCGLTVISERYPQFPSLALSYTLKSGSRMEDLSRAGLLHLIEHMLFKGCSRYDLKAIADLSDRLGGSLNAFTAKEVTQYYIKTMDSRLPEAFDLLSRMVTDSTFPAGEFEKERSVVLQEIKEAEDNPDTHAFELFYERIYPGSGLGYPIDGKRASVAALTRDGVYDTYRSLYRPERLVLSAVGNLRHADLVAEAERYFSSFPGSKPVPLSFAPAAFHADASAKKNRALKQDYVIIALEGIPQTSPDRYRFMVLNTILGSGMSSRLFQAIREEKGLAYSISSFFDTYTDGGILAVYAAVDPDRTREYLEAAAVEVAKLRQHGITGEELLRAKESLLSALVIGLESNTSKMRFNATNEIYFGAEQEVEAITAEIEKITESDIAALTLRHLDLSKASLFIYGRAKVGSRPKLS